MRAFVHICPLLVVCIMVMGLGTACEDDGLTPSSQPIGAPRKGAKVKKKTKKKLKSSASKDEAEGEEEDEKEEKVVEVNFGEDDFVEVDVENRDPFRSFAKAFQVEEVAHAQRKVLMSDVSLDEMRLIALVTGMPQPRAMFVDNRSVGYVVKSGDYIGRPEVIQSGGSEGLAVTLNWRVDRIRPDGVVLTREDPNPINGVVPTRLIALHEEREDDYTRRGLKVLDAPQDVPRFQFPSRSGISTGEASSVPTQGPPSQ